MEKVKEWIHGDESAKEMLSRVLTEHPLLRLSPIHRVPLRVGNVVELVGPSPSAKTHILMQVAVDCILPKEWDGVDYGGLGRSVMFIDLDCRFNILRLSQMLKARIVEANGSCKKDNFNACNYKKKERLDTYCDDELFTLCMRRFLYVRCYDSLEFLATLKRLHVRLQKQIESQGTRVHFLMIDSIGAFHWVDRLSSSLHLRANNRKGVSLQNVSAAVVSEIKKLMMLHPLLVIATKATILGYRYAANDVKWYRNCKRPFSPDELVSKYVDKKLHYREYMPSVWQSFVTHRILVQATDDHVSVGEHCNQSIYSLEYLLPPLPVVDKFAVNDVGVYCI